MILPGFVDAHCHAPQYVFTGTGMDLPLLAWLEKYTFPSEAKFKNTDFAKMAYEKSIKRHLKCGTTFASYFATIHNNAGKVLVDVISQSGQRAFVGKVSMDRNSPDFYIEDTEKGCNDAEEFVQYVLGLTNVGKEFLESVKKGLDFDVSLSTKSELSLTLVQPIMEPERVSSMKRVYSNNEFPNFKRQRSVTLDDLPVYFSSSPNQVVTHSFSAESLIELDSDLVTHICTPRASDTTSLPATSSISDESEIPTAFSEKKLIPHQVSSASLTAYADSGRDCHSPTATLLNQPFTPLVMPCVTPRFVPTCTPQMMKSLSQLSLKYGLPLQSHMSESPGEMDWVASLHPECETYAEVYEQFGLLHPNAYMAHCCHCSPREVAVLKRNMAGAVHCANSNFSLGSGVMDVRQFIDEGIKVGLGTDVAGGYSPSMLDAIRQTIIASHVKVFDERSSRLSSAASITSDATDSEADVSEIKKSPEHKRLSYSEAFHLATVGSAEVLNMGNVVGNFLPGKKLDCLVVDVFAKDSPIDIFDGEGISDYFQKFLFLGDDRNIINVYVDGKQVI
jgi:cytosine/adenosine deaminase-related metal-dependent hydrolase